MTDTAPEIKMDVNEFYKLAREDIAKLLQGAGVGAAAIYNNTNAAVVFYVYNYVDTVYWVSAQKTRVAAHYAGNVAASGSFFKVHPDDKKEDEFLVSPGKAYVYEGPGMLTPASG